MSTGGQARVWVAAALAAAGALIPVGFQCANAQTLEGGGGQGSMEPGLAVTVTEDDDTPGPVLTNIAVGLNTAAWDAHLTDPEAVSAVRDAGVQVLRFPGGSTADVYHWQTQSITKGYESQYGLSADATFADFEHVLRATHAQGMITVNYGSNTDGTAGGDPQEAAAWVRYANVLHHDNIRYWEIGNEVYGNGYYGATWEVDLHSDKSPQAYAENVLAYIRAMKAVDPTIQIGVVLTAPGNWPDDAFFQNSTLQPWNATVLKTLGSAIDFVDVHWYAQQPGSESDTSLLNAAAQGTTSTPSIPAMVTTLKQEIQQYCGTKKHIPIFVTETNSVAYNPGKQTTSVVNALFLADDMLSWLKAGAANVDWWDLHNSIVTWGNNAPTLYGNTAYGDYGVLSSGTSGDGQSEPPVNTPFPSYYGLKLVGQFVQPGARWLTVTSSSTDVTVYALRRPDGGVSVLAINKNPSRARPLLLATDWTPLFGTAQVAELPKR